MKINLLLIFTLISYNAISQTCTKNFIDKNYIEVTGKAEMEIIPDKISIKIVINEIDDKNKISIDELEKKMINSLSNIGIDVNNDLTISDIVSNFKKYLLNKNEIVLTKEYSLLVKDPQTAVKVFTELEKIDISNISIEKLDNSKIQDYREEVKINAIKVAKCKAEYLSQAIEQNIGKALYISEITKPVQNNLLCNTYQELRFKSGFSDKGIPLIEFEKIKLEYSILCKFELIE